MRQRSSVALSLVLAIASAADAGPEGHLDPGFGGGGSLFVLRPLAATRVVDLGVQPDGKVVVRTAATRHEASAIVRTAADGAADPLFGVAGTAPYPTPDTAPGRLAIQADGKILVGTSTAGSPTMRVLRYLADGTPDPAFGTGGLSPALDVDGDAHLVVQPDGRLLVVGTTTPRLVRLLGDGSLD